MATFRSSSALLRRLRFAWANITIATAAVVVLPGCGPKDPNKAAEAEVDRFHERWNQDDFTAIFNDAHMRFRSAHPANVTIGMLQRGKQNFGPFKSAKQRSREMTQDGNEPMITLKYDSAYEHGAAVEQFGFRMSGDKPLIAEYALLSPQSAARMDEQEKQQKAKGGH